MSKIGLPQAEGSIIVGFFLPAVKMHAFIAEREKQKIVTLDQDYPMQIEHDPDDHLSFRPLEKAYLHVFGVYILCL